MQEHHRLNVVDRIDILNNIAPYMLQSCEVGTVEYLRGTLQDIVNDRLTVLRQFLGAALHNGQGCELIVKLMIVERRRADRTHGRHMIAQPTTQMMIFWQRRCVPRQ